MVPTSLIKDFTNWKLAIVASDDNMNSEMRQELLEMGEGLRQRWHVNAPGLKGVFELHEIVDVLHELKEQKQQHEGINYVQEEISLPPQYLATNNWYRWYKSPVRVVLQRRMQGSKRHEV
jgi:hypothetical protein